MCDCVCATRMQCLERPEEGAWNPLELELQMLVSHRECLQANPGPLQEQQGFLPLSHSSRPLRVPGEEWSQEWNTLWPERKQSAKMSEPAPS